jgi:general secretion pathway protein F
MPLFRYRALTEQGKKIGGVIDADSYVIAKEKLRKGQIMVTDLEALKEKRREATFSTSLLLSFTRELAQLLRAGLPLYESLVTIEEKYRRHKAHSLLLDLCDRLKSGNALSSALQNYPKTFDEVYVSMVKSAEQTGSLPSIFEQLSLLLSKHQKLKKQITSALAYPAFLGGFCLIVIFSLLFFVIPSMAQLFEDRALHPITQTILNLSWFVTHYTAQIFLSIVVFSGVFFYAFRHKQGKFILHKISLRIPFLKTLLLEASLARFTRALSLLLLGGVPLVEALSLSKKMLRSPLLEGVVERAEKKIIEGKSLSSELKTSPLIPPLMIRMLSLSEETGKMAPMLHNLAEIYEEELEKNLLQLTTLLQPLLLLLLGLIVGVVLLSVLLPLTDVSSILQT